LDLGLRGKVALVGGGSKGLGHACARELAAVVAFLCSERAANVNGATVVADGGAARSLY